jgi:mannose-6-phosphate isomerase-like protein (cupin superfamily)
VVQEGQVTFPIGDTTREVRSGEMVLAPANTPHQFLPSDMQDEGEIYVS